MVHKPKIERITMHIELSEPCTRCGEKIIVELDERAILYVLTFVCGVPTYNHKQLSKRFTLESLHAFSALYIQKTNYVHGIIACTKCKTVIEAEIGAIKARIGPELNELRSRIKEIKENERRMIAALIGGEQ